jgi:predicted nucleotidyltransferase
MSLATMHEREETLRQITEDLKNNFGEKIVSALAYGSTLNEDFSFTSDFDVLLIVRNPDIPFLYALRTIKESWKNKSIRVDFNVHSDTDLPAVRKKLFWHNNRGIYVQKELELYGKVLIGTNVFVTDQIDLSQLLAEAVRVINSLNYQARKTLINSQLQDADKINLMKWCIYGSLYALASRNIFPANRKMALEKFYEVFNPPINPEQFLHIKVNRPNEINDEDIQVAYDFLTYLDQKIFQDYENSLSPEKR